MPPVHTDTSSLRGAAVGTAGVVGGLLWMTYGVLEFLAPWGVDAVYDEARAYDVVVDRMLFTVYTAPGALALLLTSVCLLATMRLMVTVGYRSARTTYLAGALAGVAALASLSGVVLAFDPLATGMRVAGSLLLGVATLAGASAAAGSGRRYVLLLGLLGVVGLLLLPLWPLVYALEVIPPLGGAAVFAAFGLGWGALGWCLASSPPSCAPTR
jgi:hypothetical protein